MLTRRAFHRLFTAGSLAGVWPSLLAGQRSSHTGGVHLALESYSLSPLSHAGLQDRWIALMQQLGLAECNMYEPLIQPEELAAKLRAAQRAKDQAALAVAAKAVNAWRASLPLSYCEEIRSKFHAAGIRLAIYTPSGINAASTDAELERACAAAKALGAGSIAVSAGRSVIKRLIPIVAKHGLLLNIQGRPGTKSNEPDAIVGPGDYEEAVGYSPRCRIDIDIGDLTGGGFDALEFVKRNQARIDRIELKDRRRDGTSMPWGQGDTPIREMLLYVRAQRLAIPCYIDCDYPPASEERMASIAACRAYIRSVLES